MGTVAEADSDKKDELWKGLEALSGGCSSAVRRRDLGLIGTVVGADCWPLMALAPETAIDVSSTALAKPCPIPGAEPQEN